MSLKYILRYKKSKEWDRPILSIQTDNMPGMSELNMPGNCIGDDYDCVRLLDFINQVVDNRNAKEEYWTNGYTIRIENKKGKKVLKIFFRLTDDYPACYVAPADFKELVGIWIKERLEFEKDPELYKKKLKSRGGVIEE